MMQSEFSTTGYASAPGKLMLAGEYSVLDGGRALAVALDGELQVRCDAFHETGAAGSTTTILELHSNLWSESKTIAVDHEDEISSEDPYIDAAITALSAWASKPAKVVFQVDANLDPTHGVGSSSALRLAVLAAAKHIAAGSLINLAELADSALELQRRGQPAASGYDIAVQSRGGLIEFRQGATKSLSLRSEDHLDKLAGWVTILVGGIGAPTGSTMKIFLDWLKAESSQSELMQLSETMVDAWQEFLTAPENTGLPALIKAVGDHRAFMAESPVFPKRVAAELENISGLDMTWTWKTTGAGGEDAVLLIGADAALVDARQALARIGWHPSPFKFTQQGLTTW